MNRVVFTLTMRQMMGRGRTVLMLLLALIPVLIAVVYRLGSNDDPHDFAASVLFDGLVVTTVLPLVSLIYGTAVLGAEIEDGTAVYLLAKPIRRAEIAVAKLLAAWLATLATILPLALIAGIVVLAGEGEKGILLGFSIGIAAGALVYCASFLFLSVLTSRALIAGLAYVFIWEGLINGLFSGTRNLSIRHYTLGISDSFVRVPDEIFNAPLGVAAAVVGALFVGGITLALAIRRLERWEIGEAT